MNLREKIFAHLKKLNFAENYLWTPPQYLNAFLNKLNPVEKKNFSQTMQELCDEDLFTLERDSQFPSYRLTKKGEELLYNNF